mmetsp:Transcript_28553/g.37051  ORF Transcript_28553/g.37051 Transcript_28553/m.37051 type:complete len:284 (-) Transcript_28553:97-948(-)
MYSENLLESMELQKYFRTLFTRSRQALRDDPVLHDLPETPSELMREQPLTTDFGMPMPMERPQILNLMDEKPILNNQSFLVSVLTKNFTETPQVQFAPSGPAEGFELEVVYENEETGERYTEAIGGIDAKEGATDVLGVVAIPNEDGFEQQEKVSESKIHTEQPLLDKGDADTTIIDDGNAKDQDGSNFDFGHFAGSLYQGGMNSSNSFEVAEDISLMHLEEDGEYEWEVVNESELQDGDEFEYIDIDPEEFERISQTTLTTAELQKFLADFQDRNNTQNDHI